MTRWSHPMYGPLLLTGAVATTIVLAGSTTGCSGGFDVQESFVRTGTVSLDAQRTLVIDTAVLLELDASRRTNEITWRLDGTVSATSAGAARNLAQAVEVEVDEADAGTVVFTLAQIGSDGLLEGTWSMTAPADLDVQVIGRGPAQTITGFQGDIAVEAALTVSVVQAEGSVSVVSGNGNVLVDTDLQPGRLVQVDTRGSIQLAVPTSLSALIEAQAGPNGTISIQHPALPAGNSNGLAYVVSVGGALSRVSLVSRAGDVFITLPL